MKKRLLSLALALVLCLGLAVPASAAQALPTASRVETSLAHVSQPLTEADSSGASLFTYIDYFFVIDRQGVLWQYRNEKHALDVPSAGFQRTWVADHVAQIGETEHGIGILKTDGTFVFYRVGDEEKFYPGVTGVVSVRGTYYLTGQGELYMYYWDTGGAYIMTEEGSRREREAGFKTKLIASNVISFNSAEGYVTADNTIHSGSQSIKGSSKIKTVVIGDRRSATYGIRTAFAIDTNGKLYGWGNNTWGTVGNGGSFDSKQFEWWGSIPTDIPLPYTLVVNDMTPILDNVEEVWDSDAIYALDREGNYWTWGDYDQPATMTAYSTPPADYDYVKDSQGSTYYVKEVADSFPLGKPYASPRKMRAGETVTMLSDYRQGEDGTIYATYRDVEYALPHTGGILGGPLQYTVGASVPDLTAPDIQPTTPTPTEGFTDVPASAYYAEAVDWAVENNITAGTSATTFSPDRTCTTAQILTFLWRAKGSPEPKAGDSFSDISSSDYFYKAALWAKEKGLVSGDTFNGDTPCTRSATVTYLWKLAGRPAASGSAFTDVPAGADYAQAVAWAVKNGVTSGTSQTTFSPDTTCTRGQIVTFLYRDMVK
ncbi:S-layer homology domain-containing protein [uncultured Dysosmobacter sp.]|uniref:S-layer homology domain-containing protein n=1 Tax=uncultured Dysosmobacter sp. TaxID=2591384 RepID=UPI00262D4E23|nr:S-layer homology domain-containing protein [uncultured Dysosmobacter sp.]